MIMKPELFLDQQRSRGPATIHVESSGGQQFPTPFSGDIEESPGGIPHRTKTPLSQMSELDRFGIAGLLETLRSENPDMSGLAIGQDLTTLGLDLNSQE